MSMPDPERPRIRFELVTNKGEPSQQETASPKRCRSLVRFVVLPVIGLVLTTARLWISWLRS